MDPKQLQVRLNALGYDAGPADGILGKRSFAALKQFQDLNGLVMDGIPGELTKARLFSATAIPYVRPGSLVAAKPSRRVPTAAQMATPVEAKVQSVYGLPGSAAATAWRCTLPFPFRIAWDPKKTVTSFACHELAAKPFTDLWAAVYAAYGEQAMRDLGLDLFGGCFNNRVKRGGSSPSMHAYGIAYDGDPDNNQLKWDHTRASFAGKKYDTFWSLVEQFGFTSLGRERDYDWMHFQLARL